MDDMLSSAACDFKNVARRWQDVAKDVENEIAIARCRGRKLTVVAHLPNVFREPGLG